MNKIHAIAIHKLLDILMTGVWLKVLTIDSETRLLNIKVQLCCDPEANF